MASTQRHCSQDQFADRVPRTAERGVRGRKADTDTNAAVGRDHFENDVKGRVSHGVVSVVVGFSNRDEEHCERYPPDVMA